MVKAQCQREGCDWESPEGPGELLAVYLKEHIAHPMMTMTYKDFQMSLAGQFRRPVLRQSHEGTSISRAIDLREGGGNLVLLNSKSEFHQPGQVRESYGKLL